MKFFYLQVSGTFFRINSDATFTHKDGGGALAVRLRRGKGSDFLSNTKILGMKKGCPVAQAAKSPDAPDAKATCGGGAGKLPGAPSLFGNGAQKTLNISTVYLNTSTV